MQCGAVSGNVHTVNCLCDGSQSNTTSCVRSRSAEQMRFSACFLPSAAASSSSTPIASCSKRWGVPTAKPMPCWANCCRCSVTEPFLGKSLAALTLRLASSFNTATARRAEMQTMSYSYVVGELIFGTYQEHKKMSTKKEHKMLSGPSLLDCSNIRAAEQTASIFG